MSNIDRTERCELTVLCLVRNGSRVLLQNRVKSNWRGWTLPGGHVEPGESITDAVIREMREETGLTVTNPRLCGVKHFPIDGGRYIVFLYAADSFTGELRSSEEGEMQWIERAALDSLPCVKDFHDHLRVIEDASLSEFEYVRRDGEWIALLR